MKSSGSNSIVRNPYSSKLKSSPSLRGPSPSIVGREGGPVTDISAKNSGQNNPRSILTTKNTPDSSSSNSGATSLVTPHPAAVSDTKTPLARRQSPPLPIKKEQATAIATTKRPPNEPQNDKTTAKKANKPLSLKTKLKREIEELKRNKLMQQQRIEEEKKQRKEEKRKQKEAERLLKEQNAEKERLEAEEKKKQEEQRIAEEKRRKEQREVLRRQAAELLKKQEEGGNTISPNKFGGVVFGTPKRNDNTPTNKTPENTYHRPGLAAPLTLNMTAEELQKLAAEEQRRKEQREVLRRQAAELLKKKEAEGTAVAFDQKTKEMEEAEQHRRVQMEEISRQQRDVLKQQAAKLRLKSESKPMQIKAEASPARSHYALLPPNLTVEEHEKLIQEEQRRRDQREVLRRQAAELLKKNHGKLKTTPTKTAIRKSPTKSSPKADLRSPGKEKQNEELKENLKKWFHLEASEQVPKESAKNVPASNDSSIASSTLNLTEEQKKFLEEEENRKKNREGLRRQALELLKKNGETKLLNALEAEIEQHRAAQTPERTRNKTSSHSPTNPVKGQQQIRQEKRRALARQAAELLETGKLSSKKSPGHKSENSQPVSMSPLQTQPTYLHAPTYVPTIAYPTYPPYTTTVVHQPYLVNTVHPPPTSTHQIAQSETRGSGVLAPALNTSERPPESPGRQGAVNQNTTAPAAIPPFHSTTKSGDDTLHTPGLGASSIAPGQGITDPNNFVIVTQNVAPHGSEGKENNVASSGTPKTSSSGSGTSSVPADGGKAATNSVAANDPSPSNPAFSTYPVGAYTYATTPPHAASNYYSSYPYPYPPAYTPYPPLGFGYMPTAFPGYYPAAVYPPYVPLPAAPNGYQHTQQNQIPYQAPTDTNAAIQQQPKSETQGLQSTSHGNITSINGIAHPGGSTRQPKTTNLKTKSILCATPLEPPSPFSLTHIQMKEKIVILKKPGESFGVTVNLVVESALVFPSSLKGTGGKDGDTQPKISAAVAKVNENKTTDSSDNERFDAAKPKEALITPSSQLDGNNDEKTLQVSPQSTEVALKKDAAVGFLMKKDAAPKRKERRKRIFFSVMAVMNASTQNTRKMALSGSSTAQELNGEEEAREKLGEDNVLLKGDIIFSINGFSTAGLTFVQSCELFKSCTHVDSDGFIRCALEVARLKPAPKPEPLLPPPKPLKIEAAFDIRSLQNLDMTALVVGLLKAITNGSSRCLGSSLSDEEMRLGIVSTDFSLKNYPLSALKLEWNKIESDVKIQMLQKVSEFWKSAGSMRELKGNVGKSNRALMTDSKISAMRAVPRPANGRCKCGSEEHQYVNDPDCILYRNLRSLDQTETAPGKDADTGKISSSKSSTADMKVVEKAFKDRFMRIKNELEASEAEAKFVDRMEEIQITQLNQAVFTPSLYSIVLSAVVEIGMQFKNTGFYNDPPLPSKLPTEENSKDRDGIESDEEDNDDIPLALLGAKRKSDADTSGGQSDKKTRRELHIKYHFLLTLLRLISEKWGHIYKEPRHSEYAWRWEVFHGHNAGDKSRWSAGSKNPRKVNSLSLENARFLVDDDVLSAFVSSKKDDHLKALKVVAFLLEPQQTGVCDELLSFLRNGVLRVDDEMGIPVLSDDWWTKVDFLLLNEMHECWGEESDPKGKYGILDEIRSPLCKNWVRDEKGWFLKDEDDIIFYFDEINEWREAFEHKHEAYAEGMEGIGKFY